MHPTLFRFMHGLKSTVICDGVAVSVQAQTGNLARKPVDKARQFLLSSAEEVETAYQAGEITAQDVLMQGAAHFQNERLLKYFATLEAMPEVVIEEQQLEEDELPDVDVIDPMEVDDREAVLNADEGLQDMDDDPWITTVWPSAAEGND